MRREPSTPRPDLIPRLEHLGFTFHTIEEHPYWNESAAYCFTRTEVDELESATNELHAMCLAAVERVITENLYEPFAIPWPAQKAIQEAWDEDPPAIYGRFDLVYDGQSPPKMLEYNADTPTSLLEAAVVQWHWLQDIRPSDDQFNSIYEGLVEKWSDLKREGYLAHPVVHFASMDVMEDVMTTAVLMDTAEEAGLKTKLLTMAQIEWDSANTQFCDDEGLPIQTLFKLYPWEWMIAEEFGTHALQPRGKTEWIEPIWKMILSNKAILAVLWEMFPDHPNLVPAYTDGPHSMTEYVKKPILGREGSNVSIYNRDEVTEIGGPYDQGPWVYQQYVPLPVFEENHVLIGSWVIDGVARGIGIRESDGPITEDLARFVPHFFTP